MVFRKRALFLVGLLAAVSCSDAGSVVGPEPTKPAEPRPSGLQVLDCRVDLRGSPSVRCDVPQPGTGSAPGLIVGGQNLYVTLTGTNIVSANDTLSFDATVRNLIPQALGVDSTGAVHPAGVRVFFQTLPFVSGGTGSVEVANPDGTEVFISDERPYFQYAGGLETGETSEARSWRFAFTPGVTAFSFKVYVWGEVQYPNGWLTLSPDTSLVDVNGVDTLAADVRDAVGRVTGDPLTWTSANPAVASVTEIDSARAEVLGVAQGSTWIYAASDTASERRDSVFVVVNNSPTIVPDSLGALENVTVPVDSAHGLLANDADDEPLRVLGDSVGTAKGGTAWLQENGSLEYLSAPGFSGRDTIFFDVQDGARTVPTYAVVDVQASPYWYLRAGASGDGRDRAPFGSVPDALSAAGAGDTLIVLAAGTDNLDGAWVLEPSQAIVGQGIPADIVRGPINGATVLVLDAGGAPGLTRTTAGPTVTLGTDNVIAGVGITAGAGAAIQGSGFGTLTVAQVDVNPRGPALSLTNGTLNAAFGTLSSDSSATEGIRLSNVGGTLTAASGLIRHATGTAVDIAGGDGSVAYPGEIQNRAGRAVSVSGRSGGTVALLGTVADSAAGTGISVTDNTAGDIVFGGFLSLAGGGIVVDGNTGGAISFLASSKIVDPASGPGVTVTDNPGATVSFSGGGLLITTDAANGFTASGGGTVSVTGAVNAIASGSGATALELDGIDTGVAGMSFFSVSTSSGALHGIRLDEVTGAGVQVTGAGSAGSGGVINATGHGVELTALGSTPVRLASVSVNGTTATGAAALYAADADSLVLQGVNLTEVGGPALSLSAGRVYGTVSSATSVSSTTSGAVFSAMDGNLTISGGTLSPSAGTVFAVAGGDVDLAVAAGIQQNSNSTPLVAVTGGHTGTLALSGTLQATVGTGLVFNDADGTYNVTGSASLGGGDAGVDITNGSSGSFTFGSQVSVSSPSGTALYVYGSAPTVAYAGSLSKGNAGRVAEISESTGTVGVSGTVTASGGDGILFSNFDGTATFTGTTTLTSSAGIDVASGSSGTITFGASTSVTTATGTALDVAGSSPNLTFQGSLSAPNGLAASVSGAASNLVDVTGSVSSGSSGSPTGLGILVQNNTGGTVRFSGSSKSLYTGANPAVRFTGNSAGAALLFTGGSLAVNTTTAAGITATGAGTLSVTGASNSVSTTTGTPVSLAGISTGTDGISLAGVTTTAGAANGIVLNGVNGTGLQVAGGTISGTTGAAVSLTSTGSLAVNLNGMTLSRAAGTGAVVEGSTFGTLSLGSGTAVSASGGPGALSLNAGSLNGTFALTASGMASGTHGASLTGVGGTYTVNGGGSVAAAANADAVRVSGGNAAGTWSIPLSASASGARAVNVASTTGGTLTFSGTVSATSTSAGATVVSNTGNVSFTTLSLGTAGSRFTSTPLALTMGSGNVSLGAFTAYTSNATGLSQSTAAGSGTLSVTSGTADATGAPAVSLAPSSGTQTLAVTLTTVNANGGAGGIVLANTGGAFSVAGSGSAGTGGTLQNTSGSGLRATNATDVALNWMNITSTASTDGGSAGGTCGNDNVSTCNGAVDLTNVTGVTLNRLAINGSGEDGIVGSNVTNLTVSNSTVQNAGNNPAEHGMVFTGLYGAVSIASTSVTSSAEANFRALNTSGTVTMSVANSTFANNSTTNGGDGFLFDAQGTAVATVNVTGSTFTANRDDHFNVTGSQAATVNVGFTGNTLAGGNGAALGQGIALRAGGTYTGTFTYDVNGNTINGAIPTAINVGFGSTGASGLLQGRIRNNLVGTSGSNLSGSAQGSCILAETNGPGTGTHTVSITGNTLRRCFDKGIDLLGSRDGSNKLNATVTGNNVNELVDPSSRWAIRLETGSSLANETGSVCADIQNNTLNAQTIGDEISVRVRSVVTARFPGYTGGTTDTNALQTYLQGRNPSGGTALASVSGGSTYNNTVPAGSACPTPP